MTYVCRGSCRLRPQGRSKRRWYHRLPSLPNAHLSMAKFASYIIDRATCFLLKWEYPKTGGCGSIQRRSWGRCQTCRRVSCTQGNLRGCRHPCLSWSGWRWAGIHQPWFSSHLFVNTRHIENEELLPHMVIMTTVITLLLGATHFLDLSQGGVQVESS